MKRGDVVKNFLPYAPIKFGSAYYKRPTSEQAFPVYVENIIVRDIQLLSVAEAARHSSATSRGQQEDRARAPSRGLVLPFQAVLAMGC